MITIDSGVTARLLKVHRSSLSLRVGPYRIDRTYNSHAVVAATTTSTTTTVIPRHGTGGIGRSNSSGGPPWICSARDGFRKNNRGRRSRSLKLEINEGITASLSKNNCADHQRPGRGHDPARQTGHRCFDITITERAVDADHANGHARDLEHFARGEKGIAVSVPAEHSGEHSTRNREIGGAKINPGDGNGGGSSDSGQNARG